MPQEALRDDPGIIIISGDTRRENRIPPNQARTKKWPVLDAFGVPNESVFPPLACEPRIA